MEEGKYLSRLRERFAAHPESRLFLSLAEECWRQGRDEEAFVIVSEGIEKDPAFVHAKVRLGRWLLEKGAYCQAEKTFSEAAESYRSILDENPGDETAMARSEELVSLLGGVERAEALNSLLGEIKSRFGYQ
ncbi:MAG: hypothetical protein HGA78_05075 [Nitrospirales bacterium]|nr:hypothetical protein [Nitrospirales bacterium]